MLNLDEAVAYWASNGQAIRLSEGCFRVMQADARPA